MVAMMIVAAVVAAQPTSVNHVRTAEPRISMMIHAGLARSETFRRLVVSLDQSDVIVYVELKATRQSLGGFLENDVIARGGYRYLRIAIDASSTEEHVVPVLAHELQHAFEVAQDATAVNAQSVEQLFARLGIEFACNGPRCSETRAAMEVEAAVKAELKAAQ